MSSPAGPENPGAAAFDPGTERGSWDQSPPGFSFAVGRALGTVVVTVHGELDESSSQTLAAVLTDLVDNQGNLAVAVDARDMTVADAAALRVFRSAARSARLHGGNLAVTCPSDTVSHALEETGLPEVVAPGGRPAVHRRR